MFTGNTVVFMNYVPKPERRYSNTPLQNLISAQLEAGSFLVKPLAPGSILFRLLGLPRMV
jgi:hypothetical protein